MKFDFVIGNPPFQKNQKNTSDNPLYHDFMSVTYLIGEKVELITPARFLFNAGKTPKKWNQKMLDDEHFKVLLFECDGKKLFPNTDIKGGVAIHYRDVTKNFGAIVHFIAFQELNFILKKVLKHNETSLMTIIYNQNKFNLNNLYSDYPKLKNVISSNGREKRMTSGCIGYDCFHDTKESEDDIKILGVIKNKRCYRFINRNYLEFPHENIDKYKIIVPANNGSGAIGTIGTPLISTPLIGYTQTFIGIGAFSTQEIANNALKYIKGKFSRTMLGVLKVTQNGRRDVWKYVPLQDFTENSDIDWSKSIHEIDLQLYKKYGLDETEIQFIESHVKEMN